MCMVCVKCTLPIARVANKKNRKGVIKVRLDLLAHRLNEKGRVSWASNELDNFLAYQGGVQVIFFIFAYLSKKDIGRTCLRATRYVVKAGENLFPSLILF